MKSTLKALLAAALITAPVLTLDAAQVPAKPGTVESEMTGNAAQGCCYVYIMGRWWCVPCF